MSVDAYMQTEPPTVKDAGVETESFLELKRMWWREYHQSQGKAFEQQKGT